MKKLIFSLLAVMCLTFSANKAHASHAMGVDLSYQYLFGNFYQVTLTYYRDCSGISVSSSATVYFNSPSGCGASFSHTLPLLGTGTEVSPLCPSQLSNSTCNGGTIPGVEQYIFQDIVEIPTACTDWNISYSECCRNDAGGLTSNLVTPTSFDIYVEATLDNTSGLNNNSPQFTTLPVPYICANQPFTYNHGAFDPDGDSLVYTLIPAQDGPYPGTNIGYNAPASATNPIVGVANVFDSQTGSINVNPDGTDQLAVMAVRVDEYRNGVLIGSTIRDLQVVIRNCTNVQPQDPVGGVFNQVGGVNIDGNSIEVCPGEALSFEIEFSDANAGDIITLIDNLSAVIPGATLTSSGTNPVIGTFSWTPTGADAGFHTFTVTVQDDGCPILGSQVFAYDILVQDGTYAGADQTYCPGGIDPQLNVTGGSVFDWTYLGNGDGSGMGGASVPVNASFSCNPCDNPIPNPSTTTTYIVTSNLSSLCKNKDTVTVTVSSGFTLTMPSNQTICLNEAVNLPLTTPGGTYTYNWSPSTSLDNSTISNPLASPTSTTTYTATVTNTATGCRNQDVVDVTVAGVGPGVLTSNDTNICAGESVQLLATPFSTECDNYTVSSITFSSTGGGGWTSSSLLGDYGIDRDVPLGISFDFYCNTFTDVDISANGFLSFDDGVSTSTYGSAIPSTATPNNIIAWVWDDLVSTTVRWKNVTISGNNVFVLQYAGYHYSNTANNIQAEIRLYENTNDIEIHIQTHNTDGGTSIFGIEDGTGANGVSVAGMNDQSWTATNQAWRFSYPQVGPTYNYTWSGGLSSTANPTATPASTTTYQVDVEDVSSGCFGTATVNVTVGANYALTRTPGASTNICYGNSVNLGITPSVGGSYSYAWTPTANMTGAFTSNPTVTPTGTAYYYVDVNNGGCWKRDSILVNVGGTPVNASVDNDSICPGDVVQLDVAANPSFCGITSGCSGSSTTYTAGTGTSQTTNTPYEGFYHDARMQILYTAADLVSMGISPGVITEIGFNVGTKGSTQAYSNFTISMAGVTLGTLGGFQSGLIPVYGPTSYTVPGTGWQMHTLDTPFSWDGTCDLLVEICFNNSSYTQDDDVYYTTSAYTSVAYAYQDASAVGGCNETLDGTSSNRPNTRFTVCSSSLPGGATYSWTGTVSNSTIQSPTSSPTTSTTYDVTVDDGSCATVSQVHVGVNTATVLAATDNTTTCTGQVANFSTTLSDAIPPICDSYTMETITFGPITGGGSWTASTSLGDYGIDRNVGLGFSFDFYCNTFTDADISANGFLSFDESVSTSTYGSAIPSTNTPNNIIAWVWDDLVSTTVRWKNATINGTNAFVLQYQGYHYSNTANSISAEIRLFEGTNVIEIHIQDHTSDGGTSIFGIENFDGTIGVSDAGKNDQTWSATNEAWRFTPDQGATYSWSPPTGLDDATSANPVYTAPNGSTIDFIVTVSGGTCPLVDTITVGCTLPVELLSFDVEKGIHQVFLNWEVVDADELDKFIVQKSLDGKNFKNIGTVNGVLHEMEYSSIDDDPQNGINFYKLKMVDKNGKHTYSPVQSVDYNMLNVFNLYPNPSLGSDNITVDFQTNGSNVQLTILDVAGREVYRNSYISEKGQNSVSLSVSDITTGVYFYKVITEEKDYYGKLIISK